MSVGAYLLSAALTLVIVSGCQGGICDEGPPGKFCFEDLSGYDDCHVDPKTKKMVDDKHNCPKGTRCKCMGIPCDTNKPCGSYRLPPIWPEDYHIDFNQIDKTCSPNGCHVTYSHFANWRDTQNKKYRIDRTISTSPVYDYYIVLPSNTTGVYESYHIVPASTSCKKSSINQFPDKIQDIPKYYKYNGTEVITGINTDRWLWKAGGRNSGQQVITTIWNSYDGDKVLELRYHDPGNQMTKTSHDFYTYAGLFVPGPSDPNVFELPDYCHEERERYPKPDGELNTGFHSAILQPWQPSFP